VEANSTGGQGSRRAVAPSDDDDDDDVSSETEIASNKENSLHFGLKHTVHSLSLLTTP
jgi:hypothetical protein